MPLQPYIVAIIGLGQGGAAILHTLLGIPGIRIRYVFDINADAPGMKLAKQHGITCLTDGNFKKLASDSEVNLIFEVTGIEEVLEEINRIKHPKSLVLGPDGARIIFHLLDAQQRMKNRLEELKSILEEQVITRTDELERANRELQSKIIEYEELNRELHQINEDKTRYLLQATHQLKAPFAAIQSYVDIILGGFTGPISDKTIEIMGKVKDRCQLLSGNIKEMLELAHLKSCRIDLLDRHRENLTAIVQEASERIAVISQKRHVKIRFDPGENEAFISCHRGQVLSLFMVLIDNASKYSYEGSEVTIKLARSSDRRITVTVQDCGIGIKEKHLDRIFDEYFRSNEAVEKNENGSGLGLAIAREVANLHHFHLDVDSQLGSGTTFTITAPIERREASRDSGEEELDESSS